MDWDRTQMQSWGQRQELGGVVIVDDHAGSVRTVALPPGNRTGLDVPEHHLLRDGERFLAIYHIHPSPAQGFEFTFEYEPGKGAGPLPDPDGNVRRYEVGPSPTDIQLARETGLVVITRTGDGTYTYHPESDTLEFESADSRESWSRNLGGDVFEETDASLGRELAPWEVASSSPELYDMMLGDVDFAHDVDITPDTTQPDPDTTSEQADACGDQTRSRRLSAHDVCGTCDGFGIIPGIGERCYNCGGSGRVDKPAAGNPRGKKDDDDNGNGNKKKK